ncbi:MAG: A/G-specific adenine glycosylase [Betaproteobacteria bacterium]|nr:A/G-specific adenine glycosylase [Betaproteobacteria bacterium]
MVEPDSPAFLAARIFDAWFRRNERPTTAMSVSAELSFSELLLRWAADHGRNALPWHPRAGEPADPYRVWVSEIMLQQTQLSTMLPYYHRFVARFPSVRDLALAQESEVLAAWSGLGYYARARNLLAASRAIERGGCMPRSASEWEALPGVGASTAAAIASVTRCERAAVLDGNVRRVFARQVCATEPWGSAALARRLQVEAQARLPLEARQMPAYTQAIMDLGATVCLPRRPVCSRCPVAGSCLAFAREQTGRFPVPADKRARPTRQAWWLLMQHEGQWAFLRRPPQGLWGGLLTLPELASAPPRSLEARRSGHPDLQSVGEIVHDFTHFTLKAAVFRAQPQSQQDVQTLMSDSLADDPSAMVWITPERALQEGLPAPLRRLVVSLGRDE